MKYISIHSIAVSVLVCYVITVLFGVFFSGTVGGFIGGLFGGFLARGISRGTLVGLAGGFFGAFTLAVIELFGYVLFDETVLSSLWGPASFDLAGLVVILAFFGILTSVAGGFIGGFLGLIKKGGK